MNDNMTDTDTTQTEKSSEIHAHEKSPAQVEEQIEQSSTPSFPDGGLQAWLTVLGAFLIQVCQFGYTSSFGVYQDFYVREYITNASPSAISWIGSFNAFLNVSGGVVAGRLYDRGHFYPLLWGGSIMMVFSLFMLSLAKPDHYYQVFLSQSLASGLGGGLIYVPSIAIISHYFQRKRALAMMIAASGSSVGAVIHPLMLNHILHGRLHFGNSVRASAGLVGGLLLVACCLMRTRLPIQKKPVQQRQILRNLMHDNAYIAASLGLMVFAIGFYFPQFYLQLDSISHNISPTFSFYSLVILNFSSILGRVIPGFFAGSVFKVQDMMVVATFASSIVIFCMILIKSVTSVVLVGIFYGFFAGAFISLGGPLMAVLTPDLSELGLRMGVAYFFSGLGILIGSPISGALLTERLIWWRAALFSGIMCVAGALFFLIMNIILRRRAAQASKM